MTSYPDVNRHLGEMIRGVATRYDLGDDDPLVGRLIADRELRIDGETTRLYSWMKDGRWLLLNGGAEAADARGAWTERTRVVSAPGAPSLLIRPDGCVAWAGRAGALRASPRTRALADAHMLVRERARGELDRPNEGPGHGDASV